MMSLIFAIIFPLIVAQHSSSNCYLEQLFDIEAYEDLVDSTSFGNGKIDVIQTTSRLLLVNQNLSLLNQTLGPKDLSHKCNKVIGYHLQNIFFSACQQNGALAFLQAYICSDVNCNPLGEKVLIPLVQLFDKAIIVGNTLLILQTDRVIYYTIVIQSTSWYLKTTSYVLDKTFFNRSSMNLTDFDIQPYYVGSQQYYRIFIVDQNDGILWVDNILKTNNLVPYNQGVILVRPLISGLKTTTKFFRTAIVNLSEFTTNFVITTKEEQNYLLLQQQNQVLLQTVLNRYKDWTPINYVKTKGNIIAIPYQNYQQTIVTALYKASSKIENQFLQSLQQDYQDLLISDSLKDFLYYFHDDSTIIYKSDENILTKCQLNSYNVQK